MVESEFRWVLLGGEWNNRRWPSGCVDSLRFAGGTAISPSPRSSRAGLLLRGEDFLIRCYRGNR
jgi:hypothetical protein